MLCPFCGTDNTSSAAYCRWCHKKIPIYELPSISSVRSETLMNDIVKERTFWERRKEIGFFNAFCLTWKEVIFHPKRFFSKMAITGGLGSPLLFGIILPCIVGIAFIGLYLQKPAQLLYMIFVPIGPVLKIFITSAFIHLCLWLVGARRGFQATFRVVAYSEATFLFVIITSILFWLFWISIEPVLGKTILLLAFPILMMATTIIWPIALYIIGFKRAHNIKMAQATLGILIYLILVSAFSFALHRSQEDRIYPLIKKSSQIPSIWQRGLKEGVRKEQECEIDGILYSRGNPSVMINRKVYYLNDFVCGGKIIDISRYKVTIQFQDGVAVYGVGTTIKQKSPPIAK